MRTIESRMTQLMTVCGHGALLDAEGQGQQTQDTRDSAKANAGL